MAIKQRKQVTGTTEQINAYAGVEGQLVWNKTTKRWVGMSGTAGTNYPMASERHQHSIANVTDLQKTLDSKATTADISNLEAEVTKDLQAVNNALAGKANTSHTHTKSQITDFPAIPDTSTLIPKTGARGSVAGWEVSGRYTGSEYHISKDSPDTLTLPANQLPSAVSFVADKGDKNTTFTKVVNVSNIDTFTLGDGWKWSGGKAPAMKNGFVVLHWNDHIGIATLIAME